MTLREEQLELELSLALARNAITRKWFIVACQLLRSQRQEIYLRVAFVAALVVVLVLITIAACTTARRPPWIIEQPLYKQTPPTAKQPLEKSP